MSSGIFDLILIGYTHVVEKNNNVESDFIAKTNPNIWWSVQHSWENHDETEVSLFSRGFNGR